MGRNGIVAILVILCISLILYLTWKEPSADWRSKYKLDSYEPFNLAVSQGLLEDQFEIKTLKDSLQNSLLDSDSKGTYLYIGGVAHDSTSLEQIKQYCEKGNDAHLFLDLATTNFFYSSYFDTYTAILRDFLADQMNLGEKEYFSFTYFTSEEITVKMDKETNPSEQNLKFTYPEGTFNFTYYYLDYEYQDYVNVLGLIEDDKYSDDFGDIHYFNIPLGEGKLYIHLCPLALSNYSLIDESNLAYFEDVVNNFESKTLLIDDFNSQMRSLRAFLNSQNNSDRSVSNNGPLSYIFANPSLKYAWYMILAGIIAFILFQAKRKQRSIPVLAQKKNRSLEFIEQSAQIFYRSKDHNEISKIQIAMFNNYIKEEYGLNFNAFKKDKIAETAKKINIPEDQIEKVGDTILYIERLMNVEEKDLVKLNRQLENFYHLSENK
jgi:hypothetical protein